MNELKKIRMDGVVNVPAKSVGLFGRSIGRDIPSAFQSIEHGDVRNTLCVVMNWSNSSGDTALIVDSRVIILRLILIIEILQRSASAFLATGF